MIVHTSSWHYKLLRFWDVSTLELDDSCRYIRKVVTTSIFSAVVFALLMAIFGDLIAWVLAGLIGGWTSPNIGATIVLVATAAVVVFWSTMVAHEYHQDWKAKRRSKPDTPPSFAKQAYRQWRDKFCTRVDIVR